MFVLSPEHRRAAVQTTWLQGMTALAAFGSGQYPTALESFKAFAFPATAGPMGSLQASLDTAILGNSAEQRDVLEEAFMWAALRSGQYDIAADAAWKRSEVR